MLLLPILGIVVFVGLYIIAALTYPGGSSNFPGHTGFNFWNNYLCDLLDEYALNGELNTARFYARMALTSLCTSLLLLWFYLPKLFNKASVNLNIMWLSGLLSLLTVFFLAAHTHDIIIRISGIFGAIAFISSTFELYRARFYKLSFLGILSLFIFLVNYYIYETGIYIRALPSIQKVTFVVCISWFLSLNLQLFKKIKLPSKQIL
ncbi:MAG: hypothetical protein HKN52_04650 [Eudoraea sp.]|nr:hypothetical protein [Eudoraea sp.]